MVLLFDHCPIVALQFSSYSFVVHVPPRPKAIRFFWNTSEIIIAPFGVPRTHFLMPKPVRQACRVILMENGSFFRRHCGIGLILVGMNNTKLNKAYPQIKPVRFRFVTRDGAKRSEALTRVEKTTTDMYVFQVKEFVFFSLKYVTL